MCALFLETEQKGIFGWQIQIDNLNLVRCTYGVIFRTLSAIAIWNTVKIKISQLFIIVFAVALFKCSLIGVLCVHMYMDRCSEKEPNAICIQHEELTRAILMNA